MSARKPGMMKNVRRKIDIFLDLCYLAPSSIFPERAGAGGKESWTACRISEEIRR
jgi:hypothetical protein